MSWAVAIVLGAVALILSTVAGGVFGGPAGQNPQTRLGAVWLNIFACALLFAALFVVSK